MSILRFMSPRSALGDLRAFLRQRSGHHIVFMSIAALLTGLLIAGFVHDAHIARPYKRDIQYVQSWPLSRTDAQIVAQQKIDGVEQTRRENELKRQQAETQASFKRLDDKLKKLGI